MQLVTMHFEKPTLVKTELGVRETQAQFSHCLLCGFIDQFLLRTFSYQTTGFSTMTIFACASELKEPSMGFHSQGAQAILLCGLSH